MHRIYDMIAYFKGTSNLVDQRNGTTKILGHIKKLLDL